MLIFKLLVASTMPSLSENKKIDAHCEKLKRYLKDETQYEETIKISLEIFGQAKTKWAQQMGKDVYAIEDTPELTEELFKQIPAHTVTNIPNNSVQVSRVGRVISVKVDKYGQYVGFIKADPINVPFFEKSNLHLQFINMFGKIVLYDVETNYNGNLTAVNARSFE